MGLTKEPKTGRKGGPISKIKKNKIKQDIISLLDEGRFSEINNNKLEFARQNKITRVTLNKILKELKPELDEIDSDLIKVDIIALYERMKRRILYWWDKCENADEEEQSFMLEKQVFREMREVLRDFRQTCIDLGVIDKISDKLEIQGDIKTTNTQINYFTQNNIVMALDENLNDKLNEEDKQKLILDIMSKNEISNESDIQS